MNLRSAIALTLIALTTNPAVGADLIKIPRSRLEELERRAADADRLEREVRSLKGLPATSGPITPTRTPTTVNAGLSAKPSLVEIPATPPAPALSTLPPLDPQVLVLATDLLAHYRESTSGADLRYRKKTLKIKGVIAELNKELFTAPYQVIFREPGKSGILVCEIMPNPNPPKLYLTADRTRIVAETTVKKTLVTLGDEVEIQGRLVGFKNDRVLLKDAELLDRR